MQGQKKKRGTGVYNQVFSGIPQEMIAKANF